MKNNVEIQYSGFELNVISGDKNFVRNFTPGRGEYSRNLFTSYIYRGAMYEYRSDTNELDHVYPGESFYNTDVTLPYETYERFDDDTTWLCFASWKPIKSEFVRLQGQLTVAPNTGVFCVLGTFTIEGQEARALNYVKPRDHEIVIDGDAKILLFTDTEKFVNVPTVNET